MLKQMISVTMCDHSDKGDERIMSSKESGMSGTLQLNAMVTHLIQIQNQIIFIDPRGEIKYTYMYSDAFIKEIKKELLLVDDGAED